MIRVPFVQTKLMADCITQFRQSLFPRREKITQPNVGPGAYAGYAKTNKIPTATRLNRELQFQQSSAFTNGAFRMWKELAVPDNEFSNAKL